MDIEKEGGARGEFLAHCNFFHKGGPNQRYCEKLKGIYNKKRLIETHTLTGLKTRIRIGVNHSSWNVRKYWKRVIEGEPKF